MNIKIITTFENAKEYLSSAKNSNTEPTILWKKHMIEPFWNDISAYAPFDQSFKQPACIKELDNLDKQLSMLSKLDISGLHSKFMKVAKALTSEEDDPMLVAFYPLCESNKIAKERQNGIIGTSVFGNMTISINPLAEDWQEWIPFVFAHEYHHNIWGHNWYVLRGGKDIEGTFLEYMITEGQADLFAMSLFPDLTPQWNQPIEKTQWERISRILYSKDPEIHAEYMFGNEKKGLPWCVGYSFGTMIVADYLQKNPLSFSELLHVPAKQIFEASMFYQV